MRDNAGDGFAPVPEPSIRDVIAAVAAGRADRALVPIETAVEGSVDATLDALLEQRDVAVVGELVHPVHVMLLGRPGLDLDAIEAVLSHPQALAQCATFLRDALPRASVRAAASSADAVRTVAGSHQPWAAIGTRVAGSRYGCAVLAADVEDHPGNATRFAWVAPAGTVADGPATKTSVVFWGAGAQEAGWLVRCLAEFASRGVNLTRIESRPRKDRLGRYVFFVDLDGGATEPGGPVASALLALRAHCEEVRALGSYPAA